MAHRIRSKSGEQRTASPAPKSKYGGAGTRVLELHQWRKWRWRGAEMAKKSDEATHWGESNGKKSHSYCSNGHDMTSIAQENRWISILALAPAPKNLPQQSPSTPPSLRRQPQRQPLLLLTVPSHAAKDDQRQDDPFARSYELAYCSERVVVC